MNLKPTPARTASGLRHREAMREQVSNRFTSIIGLARIEWCQDRHEFQEDHRAAARGATRYGLCGRFFGPLCQQYEFCLVVHRHHPAHRLDRCRTIGAQESVVPYLLEPGGQDVLEEAAEEFHRVQRHLPQSFGSDAAVGEGDVAILAGDDPAVTDRHSEDVRGEIAQ